ncbi:unnamed protein product [Didymodactylos carnosus]|uniref:Uncharacterized protein n=1 Tax=Didymodactylos carnosus TaxID=1234261 RepID=A0A8S2DDA2_9BILA|nr:unnamed protein product [Didymodactylos carnosus]CAF3652879.1 unnamed protein product [Didymodactylos carnosus]
MSEHIPIVDGDEIGGRETNNEIRSNLRQIGPYRSLSAKRPKDTNHPRRVSFNDVPIIHEVPSFDLMRNSNCESHRSWTYTGTNLTNTLLNDTMTNVLPSSFNTKLHANRISSAYYNSTSNVRNRPDLGLNATVPFFGDTNTRLPDWLSRPKAPRITTAGITDAANGTNDTNSVPSNTTSKLQIEQTEAPPPPVTPMIVITANDSKDQEHEINLKENTSNNHIDTTINNDNKELTTASPALDIPQKSIIRNSISSMRHVLPNSVLYNNSYISSISSSSNPWKSVGDSLGTAPSTTSLNENDNTVKHPYRSAITPLASDNHHPMFMLPTQTTTSEQQPQQQQHNNNNNNNQRNFSLGYSNQQQPSYLFRENTPSESSATTYTSTLSTNIENPVLSLTSIQQSNTRNSRIRSATLPLATRFSSNTNDTSSTNNTYSNVSITPLTIQTNGANPSITVTNALPLRNSQTTTNTIVPPPSSTRVSSAISNPSSVLNRTVLRPTTIAFQCNASYQTTPILSQFPAKDSTLTMSNISQQTPSSVKQMPIQKTAHNPRFMQRPSIPMTSSSSTTPVKYSTFANTIINSNNGENITHHLKTSSTTTTSAALQRARSANVFRRSPVDAFGNVTTSNNNTNMSSMKRNPNVRQTYGSYYMQRVLLPTTTN